MKKREVKYKDYQVWNEIYTVKQTYLPTGGIECNPAVRVEVMEQHPIPRNLWERITEWFKYNISTYVWDPLLTDASLDFYCMGKCVAEATERIAIKKTETEWTR
jgi:hypothetical protein